jgi:hypothetical protein
VRGAGCGVRGAGCGVRGAGCGCGVRVLHVRDAETRQWNYWPPKGGPNRGQPPHHRVCEACKASLAKDNLDKEEHRVSRCGLDYLCPDGACGPDGCLGEPNVAPCFAAPAPALPAVRTCSMFCVP